VLLSIITITRRLGGLDVAVESLKRQSIWKDLIEDHDVEWIFVDEYAQLPERQEAFLRATIELGFDNADYAKHVYPPDYDPPRRSKLCRASNTGLKYATGTYLLLYNDYIWMPRNTIATYLDTIRSNEKALITGINHRTQVPPVSFLKPNTKERTYSSFKEEVDMIAFDEADRQAVRDRAYSIFQEDFTVNTWDFPNVPLSWQDIRKIGTGLRLSRVPHVWEANVAMVRRDLVEEVGGWSEDLDYGYGYDNCLLAQKILAKHDDAKVAIEEDIVTISLDDRIYFTRPDDHDYAMKRNQDIVVPIMKNNAATNLKPRPKPKPAPKPPKPILELSSKEVPKGSKSIAFWMPDVGSWGAINPENPFGNALGGRETAAIRLAQEFTKNGWTTTIFCPITHSCGTEDFLTWFPADKENARFLGDYDVVVSMENPGIFKTVRARKLNLLHAQCTYSHAGDGIGDLDPKIDHYMLLSNYQRFTMRTLEPQIDADKCVILGNGIDLERYDSIDVPVIPGRMVWSSSPDRGLWHLLRWWPTLKAKYPHITLKVFYNIKALEPYKWAQELRAEWALAIERASTLDGVEYVGKVDQATLAREQKQAECFIYPCDPAAPTETWCITALENCAAGVPMLLSDVDCLGEVYGAQRGCAWFIAAPIRDDDWLKGICAFLDQNEQVQQSIPRARAFAEAMTWEKIGARWRDFLEKRLELTDPEAILQLVEEVSQPVLV
jgi:hypothetical protein